MPYSILSNIILISHILSRPNCFSLFTHLSFLNTHQLVYGIQYTLPNTQELRKTANENNVLHPINSLTRHISCTLLSLNPFIHSSKQAANLPLCTLFTTNHRQMGTEIIQFLIKQEIQAKPCNQSYGQLFHNKQVFLFH